MRLAQGADPATTATQFLPGGSYANGGAMRIAPVGLAYRNADAATLQQAVEAALLCTHTHPLGVEGALAQVGAGVTGCRTRHCNESAADAGPVHCHIPACTGCKITYTDDPVTSTLC
jgi:ADP-ribosylglycohydrolase